MKSCGRFWWGFVYLSVWEALLLLLVTGCKTVQSALSLVRLGTLAFVPPTAKTHLAKEIAPWQQKAHPTKSAVRNLHLEPLGWKYTEPTRAQYEPSYLPLAVACAVCLQARQPQSLSEAMVL